MPTDPIPKDAAPPPDSSSARTAPGEQWLEGAMEQVFLSPRVVDERAFEELSGSLKGLIKDAAGQSRALIATTGEVKLLGDQLREATKELQARVETAVRVIPTLDQRMNRAEQLLDAAVGLLVPRYSGSAWECPAFRVIVL